jgi:hypothetical protein
MARLRFQFTLKASLIAVALIAVPLSFLRRSADGNVQVIHLLGPVHIGQDGTIEVRGGSVRIRRANEQTELRANRIVVMEDGTAVIYGPGSMLQTRR